MFGCYPILPNRLVYPELYDKNCLYSTDAQLLKALKFACSKPASFRKNNKQIYNINNENLKTKTDFFDNFLWCHMKRYYLELFK